MTRPDVLQVLGELDGRVWVEAFLPGRGRRCLLLDHVKPRKGTIVARHDHRLHELEPRDVRAVYNRPPRARKTRTAWHRDRSVDA